jgi:formylglycine-generating enzyme
VTCCAVAAQAVTIELASVGNAGNAGELSGAGAGYVGPDRICGAVAYSYQIGKYEVTAGQYTEFLNAKGKSDPNRLYSTYMSDPTNWYGCNIQRTGSAGSYSYSVASDWADRPVNYVNFWDAARFANWLHNGQGSGDTETGAYTLNNYKGSEGGSITRNTGARWFLPSEDEWYKAAYYDPNKSGGPGYWDYPTMSDSVPSNVFSSTGTNSANFQNSEYTIGSPYYRTEVGAFAGSPSPYGTYDQGGNVFEWNDQIIDEGAPGSCARGLRGSAFKGGSPCDLSAAYRSNTYLPTNEAAWTGFRVAAVPDPGGVAMMVGLALTTLLYWWRKRT